MRYDIHVHVAQLRGPARPGWRLRRRLRGLGLPSDLPMHNDADALVRRQLFEWVSHSSIDRFVLLALDSTHDQDGHADPKQRDWVTNNEFVADLAGEHPALFFGASIHPYRRDALPALEQAIARGACLVKWIPSAQRIRLDDPRCVPFYELLAQNSLPLLVHTGYEHTCSWRRNGWNDPRLLRAPLARGAKVIAAHCGAHLFLHERCHFREFCRMALEHEHLYGDLSAFGVPTRMRHLRYLLKRPELMAKVVYGSDFPMPVAARWLVLTLGWKGAIELLQETNPLEQPYRLLRRLAVPEEVFSRAGNLLRIVSPERVVA